MAKKIWVAGEALIDLVPSGNSWLPIVGGGPANTAKALAKLGIPTSFIGGISTDEYGLSIKKELNSVDLSLALRSDLPTALAIVTLDEGGSASYEFKLDGTATFDFFSAWLPTSAPDVLHIGTLATVIEPGATALFDWASKLGAPIVFDPNVRPSVISDKNLYREAVERWLTIATIIKLSNEDLLWLGYDSATALLDFGAELVVVTNGADGMVGYTKNGSANTPGIRVEVVDTVGAGDTVGAVLVEGLIRNGVAGVTGDQLQEVLNRAAIAAAITCSRAGAKPPSAAEIEAFAI